MYKSVYYRQMYINKRQNKTYFFQEFTYINEECSICKICSNSLIPLFHPQESYKVEKVNFTDGGLRSKRLIWIIYDY